MSSENLTKKPVVTQLAIPYVTGFVKTLHLCTSNFTTLIIHNQKSRKVSYHLEYFTYYKVMLG